MRTLTVTSGPAAGRTAEIENELVIGREGVDFEISDPEVSRRHAAFRPVERGIELEDLGSANGTYVDGRRVDQPVVIDASTTVRVGETELALEVTIPRSEPSDESIVPAADVTAPRQIPDLDVTAPRQIPDLDVTAPRQIPDVDVTAPRQIPDVDVTAPRQIPDVDVTAPRKIPDVDVTAPRKIPEPDVTAKRDVVAAPEGSPPVPSPEAGTKGPPTALVLGVVLVVLLVVLVLLLA